MSAAEIAVAAAGLTGPAIASVIDARHHRLPTPLLHASTAAVTIVIAAATTAGQPASRAITAAVVAVAVAAPAAVLWWIAPAHIGFGDVRLLAVAALTIAWIDPTLVWVWLLAALTLTGIWAALTRSRLIAFGPPLTAAALAAAGIALSG